MCNSLVDRLSQARHGAGAWPIGLDFFGVPFNALEELGYAVLRPSEAFGDTLSRRR